MHALVTFNFRKDPEMSTDKTAVTSSSKESDTQTKGASQTLSSDYAVAHTTTTTQTRVLAMSSEAQSSSSGHVATQTLSSDYTVAHTMPNTVARPRPLPKPLPKLRKPTSSSSSHVVTQTLSTDYPVSHSHVVATTKVRNVENSLKTGKKEKMRRCRICRRRGRRY